MSVWTERRLKALIFVALLAVAAAVLISLAYHWTDERSPEGADIVMDEGREGSPGGGAGHKERAAALLSDLRSLWCLEESLLGPGDSPPGPEGKELMEGERGQGARASRGIQPKLAGRRQPGRS